MVYPLLVIEPEVHSELGVECGDVIKEQVHMEINELSLYGTVKPFAVSIHLRCPWVRVVVDDGAILKKCSYVLLEL